jgi:hypothetical protein
MKKTADVICWIALGILVLFAAVALLVRSVAIFMAVVLLFAHSQLPWWSLTPAAIVLVAGFTYLFKSRLNKRRTNRTIPN